MAELIRKNGTCDLKFHKQVKNFKRVENLRYKNLFFKVYMNKNDGIYDITLSEVTSWKPGKKGRSVPDTIVEVRQTELLNKFRGNSFHVAANKILAELEAAELEAAKLAD